LSPAPEACAVNPVVPILRNPRLRYSILKITVPRATAPMNTGEFSRPIMARSTMPRSGTVMLLTMLGTVSLIICLLNAAVDAEKKRSLFIYDL